MMMAIIVTKTVRYIRLIALRMRACFSFGDGQQVQCFLLLLHFYIA